MKVKSDETLKDYGGEKKPNLSMKNCEDKHEILLDDHESRDKLGNSINESESRKESNLHLKDCEDKEKHGVFLEDYGDRDKADVTPQDFGDGNEPDLHSKDFEDKNKHCILLKDPEGKNEDDEILKDCGNGIDPDLHTKNEEKHDIFLEDHKGRDKADVNSKDFGDENEPDLHSKDCEDRNERSILLKYPGGRDEADETPKDCGSGIDPDLHLKDEEKHDIFSEDHKGRDKADLNSKDCEDRNERSILLKDPGGRGEADETPKDCGIGIDSDLHLKGEEKYDVFLENNKGSDKADVNSKDFGDENGPDLHSKDCEDRNEHSILLKDAGGRGEADETPKDCGSGIDPNLHVKDEEKHDIFLEDHKGRDKADVNSKDFGDENESDLHSKDCEDRNERSILLKDAGGRGEADETPKESGSGIDSDLHINDFKDEEKPDIFLKDHKGRDKVDVNSKDFGDENESDLHSKVCEDRNEHGILLKDLGGKDGADVTSKDFGCGHDPDLHVKDSEDGGNHDIFLEDLGDREKPILFSNESSVSFRDCEGTDKSDKLLLKDFVNDDKPDMSIRDHEDEDRSIVILNEHMGGLKLDESSKDCEDGNKLGVLLNNCKREKELYVVSQYRNEPDLSSRDFEERNNSDVPLIKDLVPQEKPDKSSKDCGSREKPDDLSKDLENTVKPDVRSHFDVGKKSTRILNKQKSEIIHKFLPKKRKRGKKNLVTSTNHKGRNKGDLSLIDHESRVRQSAMKSACLYQAFLNMMPKDKKNKTSAELLPEKKIPSPIPGNSNTTSEHDGKCTAKTAQPTPKQKKNNKKQIARKASRMQSYQKKAVLRRDLLADSSEAFLSILDSAGSSKISDKYFDGQGKLDRSGPSSFNEISKSKDVSLHLTPSYNEPSQVKLKRNAEHIWPSDFRIPKKRKIDRKHPVTKIPSSHDFQVVIMKDPQGSAMRKVDLDEVQNLLNAEVMRYVLDNDKSCFIPRFFGLSVDQIHMWLILNCKDWDTMNWVLNWKPLNARQSFTIVKSENAPWRSVKICFTIRKDKPEVKRVIRILGNQNRMLNVADWNHVKTTGHRGEWTLHFLLTVNESKQLDEVGWVIFFELGVLQVVKL